MLGEVIDVEASRLGVGEQVQPFPVQLPGFDELTSVSAVSATDIWAVGDQLGASLPFGTLTEQWHGSAWLQVITRSVAAVLRLSEDSVMIDHLAIQCSDVTASAAFYDAVLAPVGGQRVMDFGDVIGFGVPPRPEFWIGPLTTGDGFRESHIAFTAPDRAAVRAFFQAAVNAGAEVLHEPRLWPEYHPGYYGAFVRDPDGNNVEAVSHAEE